MEWLQRTMLMHSNLRMQKRHYRIGVSKYLQATAYLSILTARTRRAAAGSYDTTMEGRPRASICGHDSRRVAWKIDAAVVVRCGRAPVLFLELVALKKSGRSRAGCPGGAGTGAD